MNDAFLVRCGQSVGNLQGEINGLAGGECAAAQPVTQGFAFQQLGNDVGRAFVFADVKNGENVGVVECGSGACLLRCSTHEC
jgi:hypothetical protein